VKQLLQRIGYRFIIRSAASHTPIDLLVARVSNPKVERLAVQVKGGQRGSISKDELNELRQWAKAFGAIPVLAKKRKKRWVLEEIALPNRRTPS
jgi:Holliday junction resolvase